MEHSSFISCQAQAIESKELGGNARSGSGVEVQSIYLFTLKANDNINLSAKSISTSATESMRLICSTSSLVLDGITDMQGQIVTMEGSNKAPVSVSNTSGEEC